MRWFKKEKVNKNINENIELKPYGFAIECAVKNKKKKKSKLYWVNHYNHKIYKKREIAQKIINDQGQDGFEYRIVPLYIKK